MPDSFTIDVDTTAALAALDAVPDAIMRHLKPAAKITADNIAREAGGRLQRQLGPKSTGRTVAGITVEEAHSGDGYVVLVKNQRMPGLPQWLEFGTKFMTARPFLFASARLEESGHDRRIRDAVQAAIDEKGLGE